MSASAALTPILIFDPITRRDCLDELGLSEQPLMLYSAIGAMGVGELLRHPGQRIPTDLDAGRKFVSGGGTLDEQHARRPE